MLSEHCNNEVVASLLSVLLLLCLDVYCQLGINSCNRLKNVSIDVHQELALGITFSLLNLCLVYPLIEGLKFCILNVGF